jgi:hypothetical protein
MRCAQAQRVQVRGIQIPLLSVKGLIEQAAQISRKRSAR